MKQANRIPRTRWDTIIVGGGPAGLFAALSLSIATEQHVLLLDAGPDVETRRQGEGGTGSAFYEAGIGGAGLFSDGKLSYSLDVGGHLETSISRTLRSELVDELRSVFEFLLDESRPAGDLGSGAEAVQEHTDAAAGAGLHYRFYPVAHVGTDRCADVIAALRSHLLRFGVSIAPATRMVDVLVDGVAGEKTVVIDQGGTRRYLRADSVVLAMGKIGAFQQARVCERLGIRRDHQPVYIGARFETRAEAVMPLFRASRDPKYSMVLPGGDKVKTHCASRNGEVIALNYEGLPLAGGHNFSYAVSGRSGFSILWDGLPTNDGFATARRIMNAAHAIAGSNVIVQSIEDLRAGRPSRADDERFRAIALSCHKSFAGDLRAVLPDEFFDHAGQFLDRLETLAPGLTDGSVLYGPAIEWWMPRVALDATQMLTDVPGLYACGDGSGWSQGIVHAAATGLIAGRAICGVVPDLTRSLRDASMLPALAV